jgi:DnaJ-domain-containing protein 1
VAGGTSNALLQGNQQHRIACRRHAALRRPPRLRPHHEQQQRRARAGRLRAVVDPAPAAAWAVATLDDVYALLGLPAEAQFAEVRAAYRRLAAASHPDVDASPNASNKFKVRAAPLAPG